MAKLRYDGRVAIVTGAGGGLGRSHALLLGSLGARVVVNDLGGGATGGGQSSAAADKVVEEIRALGGEAVANYDSVEHGDRIVQTALDAFGTVDIVINNAGILRDVSFNKMTQDDWDLILKVHLTGSMSVSHAAWPILREKGYGRIIMTTSAAGIYGNFGQANYSAAKLGLAGLANTLAEEGRSKNILVNTIAPIAASRLTETVMPKELLEHLNPEAVSPLVAWLCHEDCTETKSIFEVGAGYMGKLRWQRTKGHLFPLGRPISVDEVAARWQKITDFSESEYPTSITQSMLPVLENINNPSLGGNEFIDLDVASKAKLELESEYDENDLALYALGIGAARDPMDKDELKFVYEMGNDFQALPTFGVMPQSSAMLKAAREGKFELPGMNFGFDRLLHGEQYTEIKAPLPRKAKLKHVFRFKEAFDKDPNAVVTFAISTQDENGNELVYNEMTSFVKGAGGWGGDRGPSADVNIPPEREPDAVIEEKTDPNQTLLYRLSGDWNPLHADPGFAKAFGYDRPILHGLCTFGYVGRHVVKAFCDNDGRLFKSIKVRFAKSVFPGETLITKMWKESPTRVILETRVKERDELVIKNAAVELYTEIPKPAAKSQTATAAPAEAAVDTEITLDDVFSAISRYVDENPGLVDKTKTSFQFNFKDPDSSYFIDLKNAPGQAGSGNVDKADVTLELATKHLNTLFGADMAAVQKLYFGGDLKISGNIMASNKLSVLQDMNPQWVEEARDARVAAGGSAAATATAEEPVSQEPTLDDVFAGVNAFIAQKPALVDKTATAFQFNFTNPDSSFFIDLKSAPGGAGTGSIEKPDVTLELPTEHVQTLFGGDMAAVQQLYFGGDLKISGNIMASNKLSVLKDMDPDLVMQARDKRLQSGGTSTSTETQAETPAPSAKKESTAAESLASLEQKLAQSNGLGGVIQFHVRDPESQWTLDLSSQPAKLSSGAQGEAAAVATIDDSALADLIAGKRKLQELYQKGDLRVDGDVSLLRQIEPAL